MTDQRLFEATMRVLEDGRQAHQLLATPGVRRVFSGMADSYLRQLLHTVPITDTAALTSLVIAMRNLNGLYEELSKAVAAGEGVTKSLQEQADMEKQEGEE